MKVDFWLRCKLFGTLSKSKGNALKYSNVRFCPPWIVSFLNNMYLFYFMLTIYCFKKWKDKNLELFKKCRSNLCKFELFWDKVRIEWSETFRIINFIILKKLWNLHFIFINLKFILYLTTKFFLILNIILLFFCLSSS